MHFAGSRRATPPISRLGSARYRLSILSGLADGVNRSHPVRRLTVESEWPGRQRETMHRKSHRTAWLVLLILVAAACGSADPEPEEFPSALPCDEPAQEAELGSPHREDPPAHFTVEEGIVWATIGRGTGGTGIFSEASQASLSLGLQKAPPLHEPGTSNVENALLRVTVHVDRFTQLELAPGDYWALLSQGGDLKLYSCEPAVISRVNPG